MRVDGVRVGVEVEQAPDPSDEMDEAVEVGRGARAARRWAASGASRTSITAGSPSTTIVRRYTPSLAVDVLDAGDGPRREEVEQRVPGERRPVREPQLEAAVGDEPVRVTPAGPQFLRGEVEHLLHDPVQLAHRLKARRRADLGDREVGVVEQPAGEVRAIRTGHDSLGVAPTCSTNKRRR